jgi:predicted phosphodiesterase
MKIAALADIHANYQALITVLDHVNRWKPDLILILGDIINRGPRSRDCFHLVQQEAARQGWKLIQGNHERYVLNYLNPSHPRSGLEFELHRVIYWTYQSLSKEDLTAVDGLPETITQHLSGNHRLIAWHASTAGDRVGIYPETTPSELADLVDPKANIFLVGHTHQAFVREYQGNLVINAGSVGLPFDGDKRAGYAQISSTAGRWKAEIIRLNYDLTEAVKDFQDSGFLAEGGPLAELVLAELKLGWPQLSHWFRRYEKKVFAKKLTIETAVKKFLQNPNIESMR